MRCKPESFWKLVFLVLILLWLKDTHTTLYPTRSLTTDTLDGMSIEEIYSCLAIRTYLKLTALEGRGMEDPSSDSLLDI
jgi:hypothetical protein